MRKLVRKLGFRYKKATKNRLILTEKPAIVSWRDDFLWAIEEARIQGKNLVFLDKTRFNTGNSVRMARTDNTKNSCQKAPISRGERLIIRGA